MFENVDGSEALKSRDSNKEVKMSREINLMVGLSFRSRSYQLERMKLAFFWTFASLV